MCYQSVYSHRYPSIYTYPWFTVLDAISWGRRARRHRFELPMHARIPVLTPGDRACRPVGRFENHEHRRVVRPCERRQERVDACARPVIVGRRS